MKHEFLFHKGDTPSELYRTIKDYINRYPNGVTVTVEPYCLTRTKPQNGKYQVLVRRLSEQSGMPTDEVKMKAKMIAVGHGYPVERDEEGEPIMRYGSIIPKSTKDITIGQMEILIEALYQLGLKHNIILDDVKG